MNKSLECFAFFYQGWREADVVLHNDPLDDWVAGRGGERALVVPEVFCVHVLSPDQITEVEEGLDIPCWELLGVFHSRD